MSVLHKNHFSSIKFMFTTTITWRILLQQFYYSLADIN